MCRSVSIGGLLAVVVLTSCGPGPEDRLPAGDTPQPVAPPPPAIDSPGPLATRHEAQGSFDRARAALVREDYAGAAKHLRAAAAFMHAHAEEAEIGAIAALQGAAKELEVLAERMEHGEVQTTRTFDRVFANANRAEAQHHLTRAKAAMVKRQHRPAGEEITMGVDHLERATRDLRRPRDADAEATLTEARALANLMMRGGVPTRAEARRVTDLLEAELRRLCAIIDLEARACALGAKW